MKEDRGFVTFDRDPVRHRLNEETRCKRFKRSPLLQFYLFRYRDLARSSGIRAIYETMPMSESSVGNVDEEYVTGYWKYIKEIQKEYPEYDINGKVYSIADSYCGDPSHLNIRGAMLYTGFIVKKYGNFCRDGEEQKRGSEVAARGQESLVLKQK